MRWLLLVIVFQVDADGSMTHRATTTKLFASEAACNEAGRNFRQDVTLPAGWKSMSVCVSEDFSVYE